MPGLHDAFYTTLALLGSVFLWRYYRRRSGFKATRPPSPLSLPLVGNLLSLPSGPEHVKYMKLGKQLNSDIIYLKLLGYEIVVLNSSEAASDLLDKRSGLYSDRFCPLIITDQDLLNWSTAPTVLGYNDTWRHHRRMLNKWLNTRSLLQCLLGVSTEVHPFDRVKDEIVFSMTSSIFQMAYGYTAREKPDPYFQAAHESDHNAAKATMITSFYVNIFPFLNCVPEWVPGAGWKRIVRAWRQQKDYALDAPYRWTQSQLSQGVSNHSIIADLLQDQSLFLGLSEEERDNRLKELGHVLFSGGTDTTALLLLSFIAAMVLNPDVQARAQQEIDTELGSGVLPEVSDRERLPYVNRLILEVMRWRPVLPIAIPRRCFQDDMYRGYNIAKGTIVIGNVWAITRNERIYVDPEKFNPDRFLEPNVPPAPAFGWGRR
ncbi:O-methylsterigmatocystin oxidoreductase OS=Aspergillus flavus (strain ATCC 200026 / FGSC A1120 / NRRL 3357 / JCM 12722 / SRRC 167) GN=ordA PE=2 SV=1 [Rhizoctonia solani AG-1 IB]|uniref:O-methylsterigmatocystin oxidoreductase n=1 Tax=Thanatephorus cucumeris (strain AG1-IB / isolate 7/3/14) TaxID=1108050 RepID=A0A0B7FB88_THACB|nr:O-methylsterigmatocystin oxidoreductase OS=Aspergillus flavus (strain ATCC 200026 / FGSC A1120 / NRRL 3357 / JCM 12722 / SRRC 167) GN=ordA PE=2 SV=1 [Rhizoctonia solani AG-1 IB]